MSDTMLLAVLRMPREMREADMLGQRQFDARVLEAADELDRRAKRIDNLENALRRMIATGGIKELGPK